MKPYKKILQAIAIILIIGGCKEETELYGPIYPLAGKYLVQIQFDIEGEMLDIYGEKYYHLIVSNTASGRNDSAIVYCTRTNSTQKFIEFKAGCNPKQLSIFSSNETDKISGSTININDAKLILKGSVSLSGKSITDSIYIKVTAMGEPEFRYLISGHRLTGFIEDQYK